jgi:hypothetical protein
MEQTRLDTNWGSLRVHARLDPASITLFCTAAAAGYKSWRGQRRSRGVAAGLRSGEGSKFLVSRGLKRGLQSWCSVKKIPAAAESAELFTVRYLPQRLARRNGATDVTAFRDSFPCFSFP